MKNKKIIFISALVSISLLTSCGQKKEDTTKTSSSKETSIQVSTEETTRETKTKESSIEYSAEKFDDTLTSDDFLGKAFSGTATEGEKEYPFEMAFGVQKRNYENAEGDLLYMRVGQSEGNFQVYDRLTFTPSNNGIHISAKFIGVQNGIDFDILKGENGYYLFEAYGKNYVFTYNDEITTTMNSVKTEPLISNSTEAIERAKLFTSSENDDINYLNNYSFYDDNHIQIDDYGRKFYSIRVRQNGNDNVKSMAIGFINVYVDTGECSWQ